jgi:hypothetical protein
MGQLAEPRCHRRNSKSAEDRREEMCGERDAVVSMEWIGAMGHGNTCPIVFNSLSMAAAARNTDVEETL